MQVRTSDQGFSDHITESDTLKVSNKDKQMITDWYSKAFLIPLNIV
jgi:hypothetical protein